MNVADWMASAGLDDDALAAKIRKKKARCTESWMRQIRLGHGEPSKKIIRAIHELSGGKVQYADWERSAA